MIMMGEGQKKASAGNPGRLLKKIGNDILFRIVVQYHLRGWA